MFVWISHPLISQTKQCLNINIKIFSMRVNRSHKGRSLCHCHAITIFVLKDQNVSLFRGPVLLSLVMKNHILEFA